MTLIHIDCPKCQGEGMVCYLVPVGTFSFHSENFEAQEDYIMCSVCLGEGIVEVCSYCHEPLQIRQGQEQCACDALEWPKAA